MFGKSRLISLSAAVLLTLMSTAPVAGAQAVAEFDLPPQPLSDSLRAVAKQTNTNVLFERTLVNGRTAPALKGQATANAAISRLLADTGLVARFVDEKTVVVQSADKARAERKSKADPSDKPPGAFNAGDGAGRIRLAQESATGSGVQPVPRRRTRLELEEIIVTGSHIRGIESSIAPVIVLDRAYIDSTGVSTASALIETLPQNFALTSQSGVNVPGAGSSSSREQGSSINLRAVGEGTTLVLLNGRRMAPGFRSAAVDISALPLTAIERVEILTGGASALYGSDAVGGVVNFILRDDFEGAETRLRSGWADGGVNEYRVSQVLGDAWDSGNALLSLEYYKRDLLPASERDFVPAESIIGSLFPRDKNYSAMFSGRQRLSENVSVFADALYTKRDSYNEGGRITLNSNAYTKNPQVTATLGLDWRVGGDWQIEAAGSYAENKLDQLRNDFFHASYDSLFEIHAAQVKADGSLFRLPGGSVRVAAGLEWRSESFQELSVAIPSGSIGLRADAEQIVRGAFGEVRVPLVGAANSRTGINRLEFSLAGRLDDYSTAGSSFDPQVGLMWEPINGLRFRGSHGTSYKAPNLVDYSVSNNSALAVFLPDPFSPVGISHVLQVNGIDAFRLSPQESESSSFGFQLTPESIQGLKLAFNYYRIKYTDRITNPPANTLVILNDPSSFASLFVRDPSVAQVSEFIAIGQLGQGFIAFNPDFTFPNLNFTPESVDVIVDLRRRNLGVVTTSGFDASMRYDFETAGGRVRLGLDGTYLSELEQQITAASEPIDTVGTIYNPPDWRARGSFGWQNNGWAANLFVNYTDSYKDNRGTTPVTVSSYVTADARLAYDFRNRFGSGFLSGLTISISAQNLFDQDPPRTAVIEDFRDMGFDPTNANPMGRLVAIELMKTW